jgi:hypothetical protein
LKGEVDLVGESKIQIFTPSDEKKFKEIMLTFHREKGKIIANNKDLFLKFNRDLEDHHLYFSMRITETYAIFNTMCHRLSEKGELSEQEMGLLAAYDYLLILEGPLDKILNLIAYTLIIEENIYRKEKEMNLEKLRNEKAYDKLKFISRIMPEFKDVLAEIDIHLRNRIAHFTFIVTSDGNILYDSKCITREELNIKSIRLRQIVEQFQNAIVEVIKNSGLGRWSNEI